jgi:hypothetical protein
MKVLNIVLIVAIVLIAVSTFAYTRSNNDNPETPKGSKVTSIYSRDKEILVIEDSIIYIIEGTDQASILDNVNATDYSNQTYRITTSESTTKTLDVIYEYDRLYVTAENGVDLTYYTFRYIDTLTE